MKRASHPIPKGYRRLKAGEIVRKDDLINAKVNTLPFGDPLHGFAQVSKIFGYVGHKVADGDLLSFYRKRAVKPAYHSCPEGWRRLEVGETIKADDYGNALNNRGNGEPILNKDGGFVICKNLYKTAGTKVTYKSGLAFYRKI